MKSFDSSVLKRLLSYTRPYIGYLIMALVSSIIYVVLTLLGPVLIGRAIDCIIGVSNVYFDKILKIVRSAKA